jgi:spore coat polysaccharide biosynthesis protein SpsF
MSKVSLIIQARIGSKRLPGKTLLPLAAKPLIYRIVERVKRCKQIDNLILAIFFGPFYWFFYGFNTYYCKKNS